MHDNRSEKPIGLMGPKFDNIAFPQTSQLLEFEMLSWKVLDFSICIEEKSLNMTFYGLEKQEV